MKELVKELRNNGINIAYETYWEIEPTGIFVGLFLMAIPIVFWLVFNFFTLVYLVPSIAGLYMVVLGVITVIRGSRR